MKFVFIHLPVAITFLRNTWKQKDLTEDLISRYTRKKLPNVNRCRWNIARTGGNKKLSRCCCVPTLEFTKYLRQSFDVTVSSLKLRNSAQCRDFLNRDFPLSNSANLNSCSDFSWCCWRLFLCFCPQPAGGAAVCSSPVSTRSQAVRLPAASRCVISKAHSLSSCRL